MWNKKIKNFINAFIQAKNIISQNKLTMVGFIIVITIILIAMLAPLITPHDFKKVDVLNILSAPSKQHIFGTDQYGRDILSRLIMGSRNSLIIGFGSAFLAAVVGVTVGLLAGWTGGITDSILMRIMDTILAFPSIILSIALSAFTIPTIKTMIFVISVHRIPQFARLTRGAILSLKQTEFVESARSIGQKSSGILIKHLLPNSLTPIIVYLSFAIASAINTEAALSFLGIGIRPPESSWGLMLNDAKNYVLLAPWTAIFPGLVITATILACNLLGDGLRDLMDPRIKGNLH